MTRNDAARNRRKHPRRKAVTIRELSRKRRLPVVIEQYWRPATRGDCSAFGRPCPYVGCKYHLYLEATQYGSLFLASGEPWEMSESCSLDVADRGGTTQEHAADLVGMTRVGLQKLEQRALTRAGPAR